MLHPAVQAAAAAYPLRAAQLIQRRGLAVPRFNTLLRAALGRRIASQLMRRPQPQPSYSQGINAALLLTEQGQGEEAIPLRWWQRGLPLRLQLDRELRSVARQHQQHYYRKEQQQQQQQQRE